MDFTQRKIIVSDNINDNAKRMKDSVEPFPDCSTKSEMSPHIIRSSDYYIIAAKHAIETN